MRMIDRLIFVLGIYVAIMIGQSLAQQVTRSIQFSQDPTGFLGVDFAFKHIHAVAAAAPAPVTSSCGAAPANKGTDYAGTFTPNTTTCTLTFANAYPTTPVCLITSNTATQPTCTFSTSAMTCSTVVSGTVYDYLCMGQ